jgi:hypothetical protein
VVGIAVLPFDKIDVESGMDAISPNGKSRRLRQPWSVIAYQIAGDEGLKLLNAENKAEERESPPAENLLRELISLPAKENLSTLILIDEVLTPDSSRFWPMDSYNPGGPQKSFDKQYLRDYLNGLEWPKKPPPPRLPPEIIEKTRDRYVEALKRITGRGLE